MFVFVRAFAEEGESGVAGFKGAGGRASKKGNLSGYKKTATKGNLSRGTSTRTVGGLARGKTTRKLGQ